MWNLSLSEAPQDGSPIWAASGTSDQVLKSHWAKAKNSRGGYWAGFKSDGSCDPIAWQPFVTPIHPKATGATQGEAPAPTSNDRVSPQATTATTGSDGANQGGTNVEGGAPRADRAGQDQENALAGQVEPRSRYEVVDLTTSGPDGKRASQADGGAISEVKGRARLENAEGVEPSSSAILQPFAIDTGAVEFMSAVCGEGSGQ